VQVATRAVYEAVEGDAPSGGWSRGLIKALETPHPHPPPQGGRENLSSPQGGRGMTRVFGNDLEAVARKLFPALDAAVERLRGIVPSLTMTGSGAAFFAVFENRRDAQVALEAVKKVGFPAWLCRPIPRLRDPPPRPSPARGEGNPGPHPDPPPHRGGGNYRGARGEGGTE